MSADSGLELLPKSFSDFNSQTYWQEFFQNRSEFEWYGEYANLRPIWRRAVPCAEAAVLVLGCGNSAASAEMYDDGYQQIVNVDFVPEVIQEMQAANAHRGLMKWETMDMTNTSFADRQFEVAFDKGAMDALFATDSEADQAAAARLLAEVKRVAPKYFCVTLAQEHIVEALVEAFCTDGWRLEIHQPDPAGFDTASPLFPFVFVGSAVEDGEEQPVGMVEMNLHGLQSEPLPAGKVAESLRAVQQLTSARHKLRGKLRSDELVRVELWAAAEHDVQTPRYVATVADLGREGAAGSCGVFIVPRGKEHMWMFVADEGIRQLVDQIGMTRLVVISMQPGHTYSTIQAVQDELSAAMEGMAPPSIKPGERIPYLTMDEGIGDSWQVVAQHESELCGTILVEEQQSYDGGSCIRRLLFASNRQLIQSEARLSLADPGSPKLDPEFLCFDHHKAMAAGMALVAPQLAAGGRIELVGLGSGALAMMLRRALPGCPLTTVELDPIVLELATSHFGFAADEQTTVLLKDGLEMLQEPCDCPATVVVVDVDSKDLSQGMSGPPAQFVEYELLQAIRARLGDDGLLMLNIACRSTGLKAEVVARLGTIFGHVRELKLDQDVNCVLFCFAQQDPPALASIEALQEHCEQAVTDEAFGEGVFERLNVPEQLEQLDGIEFPSSNNRGPRQRNRGGKKKKKR